MRSLLLRVHEQRRPVAPRLLIERAIAVHTPRAQQRGVTFQGRAEPDLPEMEVDPDRMA